MRKSLNDLDRKKQKHDQVKQAEKNGQANEKGRRKEQLRQEKKTPKGKQTMQNLMAKGAQLTNILITDDISQLSSFCHKILHGKRSSTD